MADTYTSTGQARFNQHPGPTTAMELGTALHRIVALQDALIGLLGLDCLNGEAVSRFDEDERILLETAREEAAK